MNFHPEGFVFSAAVCASFVNWDFRRLLKNVRILSLTMLAMLGWIFQSCMYIVNI